MQALQDIQMKDASNLCSVMRDMQKILPSPLKSQSHYYESFKWININTIPCDRSYYYHH